MVKEITIPVFNPDYVVNVDYPNIIIDNFLVSELEIKTDEEYTFKFRSDEKLVKLTKLNTKNMLINTYNLGKYIYKKFNYTYENDESKQIIKNLFISALYEQQYEFQGRLKSITKDIEKKLNINLKTDKNNIEKMNLFYKERRKVEYEIYLQKINELMKKHEINQKDYINLISLINKWLKTCGLSKKDIDLLNEEQNILPIVLLAYKIFLYLETGYPQMQIKITYTTTGEINNTKMELSVETVNDLLYYLAMGYRVFNGYGYIICEVCGNMAEGHKGKHTCSEICKKIRNGSYNKK